jgi:hypothetical protein
VKRPVRDGKQHRKKQHYNVVDYSKNHNRYVEDVYGVKKFVPRLMDMPLTCTVDHVTAGGYRDKLLNMHLKFTWNGNTEVFYHCGIGYGLDLDRIVQCLAKRISCLIFGQHETERESRIEYRSICKKIIEIWQLDPDKHKWLEPATEMDVVAEVSSL